MATLPWAFEEESSGSGEDIESSDGEELESSESLPLFDTAPRSVDNSLEFNKGDNTSESDENDIILSPKSTFVLSPSKHGGSVPVSKDEAKLRMVCVFCVRIIVLSFEYCC
eukprot:TRINITY_DN1964_c0_g1_i2.p1 TRINITY_DN1964_c0_g1~~TRINITY_DN1964_c0_g1_i2.p1  ORF type:complete len:122 (+),score=23.96 TRINITY_DN1964_c0_g1_i2:34-366(+)